MMNFVDGTVNKKLWRYQVYLCKVYQEWPLTVRPTGPISVILLKIDSF